MCVALIYVTMFTIKQKVLIISSVITFLLSTFATALYLHQYELIDPIVSYLTMEISALLIGGTVHIAVQQNATHENPDDQTAPEEEKSLSDIGRA